MKLIQTLLSFLGFYCSIASVLANSPISSWDVAESDVSQLGDATDIFSFLTPNTTGVCVGLNFLAYQGGACATLKGISTVKACLDNSHSGRSYYISPAELYSLVNVAYGTPTSIHCVRMQDYTNTSNNITSGTITCTGGSTNTCSWSTTGATANLTLGAGTTCTTVSDC